MSVKAREREKNHTYDTLPSTRARLLFAHSKKVTNFWLYIQKSEYEWAWNEQKKTPKEEEKH